MAASHTARYIFLSCQNVKPFKLHPPMHMSSNADEYNGYYIPKGTNVIGNAW
jgi:hypothetical protein